MKIISDRWDGERLTENVIADPTIGDLDQALAALDGEMQTMVCIDREDGRHLMIGGGTGSYIIYATEAEDDFRNLIVPDRGEDVVMLNIGGQIGDYRARQVVGLPMARLVAVTYFQTGTLEPTLSWEPTAPSKGAP